MLTYGVTLNGDSVTVPSYELGGWLNSLGWFLLGSLRGLQSTRERGWFDSDWQSRMPSSVSLALVWARIWLARSWSILTLAGLLSFHKGVPWASLGFLTAWWPLVRWSFYLVAQCSKMEEVEAAKHLNVWAQRLLRESATFFWSENSQSLIRWGEGT